MSQEPSSNAYGTPPARLDQVRLGIILSAIGFLIFILGAKPDWLGLDRSPVIGFVQISVFTFGMGILCLGGYLSLAGLWKGEERSILADVGARLIGTGYVVAVFAGMADIFGMGTQSLPDVPFFGPWQAVGVQVAQGMIALGLVMMIPFHHYQKK